jgi:hypothetical protein
VTTSTRGIPPYNSRPNLIESVVEVPGRGPMFYDVKPVPHGTVSIKYYQSKATGGTRRVFIYTPPNYERMTARLPVLYLLHGADGDETVWTQFGRANLILDNLISDKKVAPMVVVMPFAYAYPWHAGAAPEKQRADFERSSPKTSFRSCRAITACRPTARARWPACRWVGPHIAIGPRHPELFSRLAVFSSGGGQNGTVARPHRTEREGTEREAQGVLDGRRHRRRRVGAQARVGISQLSRRQAHLQDELRSAYPIVGGNT